MVAANVLWRTIFARLLHHLFELQEARGCTILMHTETCSVKCAFLGAKEEVDVFRLWDLWHKMCHADMGIAELESIQGWPTLA